MTTSLSQLARAEFQCRKSGNGVITLNRKARTFTVRVYKRQTGIRAVSGPLTEQSRDLDLLKIVIWEDYGVHLLIVLMPDGAWVSINEWGEVERASMFDVVSRISRSKTQTAGFTIDETAEEDIDW